MNKYTYPIQAGTQQRTINFFIWSEDEIGAVQIEDHTGYKITFSKTELQHILKIIYSKEKELQK